MHDFSKDFNNLSLGTDNIQYHSLADIQPATYLSAMFPPEWLHL